MAGETPWWSVLPHVNATLNATCAVLLCAGFAAVRAKRVRAHAACMVSALGISVLFLASYLVYHAYAGSRPFQGQGAIRPVYFAILISHTVLAAAVPPLAIVTARRGARGDIPRHVPLARWTLPIWLYVSVTGVVVYALLYHLYPGAPPA